MIEAVNSAIASAPVLRGTAGRNGASAQVSVPSAEVSAPQAPFISPFVSVDTESNQAVLQLRDSDTGEVVEQIPSESSLQVKARNSARAIETDSADAVRDVRVQQGAPAGDAESPSPAPSAPNPQVNVALAALSAGAQTARSSSAEGSVSVTA